MLTRDQQILEIILSVAQAKGVKTKSALAKKAHTTSQTINNIRSGVRGMGKRLLKKFAVALDVQEEDLYPSAQHDPPASTGDQVTLRDILKLYEAIEKIGAEIGSIKDRMLDAAQSGDIHRLGAVGGKGR